MQDQLVEAVKIGSDVAPPDMSVWGLFMQADIVVKLVMLSLVAASVWAWAVIFDKVRMLRRLEARARRFENSFWAGGTLNELYERIADKPGDPMAEVFVAGMKEWQEGIHKALKGAEGLRTGLQQRVERAMQVAINREMARAEKSMTLLASVGSVSPFVGLFGTVWGIMNSFSAIALSKNTSLAVVAPGIAEALFATALGLIAAIPAVVAYNKFSNDLGRYAGRLEGFATEFSAIVSRHLEESR